MKLLLLDVRSKAYYCLAVWVAVIHNPVVVSGATQCATDGSDYVYRETISADGLTREIKTSWCPNHPYAVLSPNYPVVAEDTTYSVPAKPIYTGEVTADLTKEGGVIGIAFSSVMIFSPYDGYMYGPVTSQATSATVAESDTFDQCGGHATDASTASYHYHIAPPCLLHQLGQTSDAHSPQIGWAADGFPIYGPRGPGGVLMQTCTETGGAYGQDVCTNDSGGYLKTDSTVDGFTFRYYFIGETNDGLQCDIVANTRPYPGNDESTYPNTPTGYFGCCPSGATCSASFLPACTAFQITPGYKYRNATAKYPTGLDFNSNACTSITDEESSGVAIITDEQEQQSASSNGEQLQVTLQPGQTPPIVTESDTGGDENGQEVPTESDETRSASAIRLGKQFEMIGLVVFVAFVATTSFGW